MKKYLNRYILVDGLKKDVCANCGKKLTFLREYHHPLLKDVFLCWGCHENVWESVVQWERFIAWESFNPETPDPSYTDNIPFIKKKDKTK